MLKNDILNEPESFKDQKAHHFWFFQEIMAYNKANQSDWSAIGMALLPTFQNDFSFEETSTSLPSSVKSLIEVEKQAANPANISNPINYEDQRTRDYQDLKWKSAFLNFLHYKPYAHFICYWDPSETFQLKGPLDLTMLALSMKGEKKSYTYLGKDPQIQNIYHSPFLIIDPNTSLKDIQKYNVLLKQYVKTYNGTIIYCKGSEMDKHQAARKLLEHWKLKYNQIIDDQLGENFLCLAPQEDSRLKYAIRIDLGSMEATDLSSMKSKGKAIYTLASSKNALEDKGQTGFNEDPISGFLSIPIEIE
jgi:hypothetical protein